MQVKVFSAARLHEALALIRREFGPDAVIMDRQEGVDASGKRIWHVHAALDQNDIGDGAGKSSGRGEAKAKRSGGKMAPSSEVFKASIKRLERIVDGLGRQESSSLRETLADHECRLAFDHLVQLGVAPTYAFDMADDFVERQPISTGTLHWAERLTPSRETARVLITGPSGAGKTTLLAKLATHYSLKGIRVAVLSTDANRMGGTDMLKSYCELLGIPFSTVRSEADVDQSLDAAKSAQLLLVDSEGWNLRRAGSMRKQRRLWDRISCTHRVLVMPATMDEVDAMEMLTKAEKLSVNQLAFSKLDETSRPGKIVNWAAATGLALSYCSFGPEVPEQMGWLTPQALTTMLGSHESELTRERA